MSKYLIRPDRLIRARTTARLTITEVAQALGITYMRWWNIEHGQGKQTDALIERFTLLVGNLGVPLNTVEELPVEGEMDYLDGARFMIERLELFYDDLVSGTLSPSDFLGKPLCELQKYEQAAKSRQNGLLTSNFRKKQKIVIKKDLAKFV